MSKEYRLNDTEIKMGFGAGNNRYIAIHVDDKFARLHCVWFCGVEDLGDGILCSYEGQKIWVTRAVLNFMTDIILNATEV